MSEVPLKFTPPEICKETVEAAHATRPKRIHFATIHNDALKSESGKFAGALNVPFGAGFLNLFPGDLRKNTNDKFNNASYWQPITEQDEFDFIEEWIANHNDIVFLKDCLHASIAIDLNMSEPGKYTQMGQWEHDAKLNKCDKSLDSLIKHTIETIGKFKIYLDANCVCATPCHESKEFDLPRLIASQVGEKLEKEDLTSRFTLKNNKTALKEIPYPDKWAGWEKSGLVFDGKLDGKAVILIDDKYQSGVTIQFIASKLLEAGAGAVFGLCLVKTLSDDDNQ